MNRDDIEWHSSCFQWFKDTKMKANHNSFRVDDENETVVSSGSKILK